MYENGSAWTPGFSVRSKTYNVPIDITEHQIKANRHFGWRSCIVLLFHCFRHNPKSFVIIVKLHQIKCTKWMQGEKYFDQRRIFGVNCDFVCKNNILVWFLICINYIKKSWINFLHPTIFHSLLVYWIYIINRISGRMNICILYIFNATGQQTKSKTSLHIFGSQTKQDFAYSTLTNSN